MENAATYLSCACPKGPAGTLPPGSARLCPMVHVTKLPFLSFFSLFFLPFGYNKPFLCPHVTCQQSGVRLFPASICQAHPASLHSTTGHTTVRLIPASLQTTHLPFLDTIHATLPQEACHSPSLSAFHTQLLMQLSHRTAYSAYCPYCPS